MSMYDKLFSFVLFGFLGFFFFVCLPIMMVMRDDSTQERSEKCDQLGGLYLEDMRMIGKIPKHAYYCIKKDSVIGVK